MTVWFWELSEGMLDSLFTKSWTRRNLGVGNHVLHIPLSGTPKLFVPVGLDHSHLHYEFEGGKVIEIVQFVEGMF